MDNLEQNYKIERMFYGVTASVLKQLLPAPHLSFPPSSIIPIPYYDVKRMIEQAERSLRREFERN